MREGGQARGGGDFPHGASTVSSSCTCARGWSSGLCCAELHTSINLILRLNPNTPPPLPFLSLQSCTLLNSFFPSLLLQCNIKKKHLELVAEKEALGWDWQEGAPAECTLEKLAGHVNIDTAPSGYK